MMDGGDDEVNAWIVVGVCVCEGFGEYRVIWAPGCDESSSMGEERSVSWDAIIKHRECLGGEIGKKK